VIQEEEKAKRREAKRQRRKAKSRGPGRLDPHAMINAHHI